MSCSYADLALASYDSKALAFDLIPTTWKRFRDDVLVVSTYGRASVSLFLEYLNKIDKTGKIQFTMQAAGDDGLEFLDLKLKMVNGKISVHVSSKPTNSFTYVLASTCYPNRNIRNVPKGIALRLRRIWGSDKKYDERSEEYQKYLIARDYQPGSVKRQFEEVKKLSRSEARRPKVKSNQVRKLNFFTTYNPSLPNVDTLVKKYLALLHCDENLKELFPASASNTIYRRNKNLKELLSPSLFPNRKSTESNSIINCNSCDICNNYMVFENMFTCTVTGKKYFVKGELHCNSCNVIYLVECSNCKQQYIGSALNFKQRFRIHKSDIKTNKDRCGTARHFNNVYCHPSNPHNYLKVQLIEQVLCNGADKDIEAILWEREKYWQSQLFTNVYGMNSVSDLYSRKRKGCRRK